VLEQQQLFGGQTGLPDLTGLSIDELARVDSDLLQEGLERLLQPCGGAAADRLWNADAVRRAE
jgi:hypothetical protein